MITSKGYKIPLSHSKVNEIKKELMICPFVENMNNITRYPVFRISEKFLYMPKYYGIKKFGTPKSPEDIKEQIGKSVDFKFNGTLRDYQIEPSELILNHLINDGSGLASIYTGWGKTCSALWIAHKLCKKTLIIVHTENLLNQWKERIKEFLDCDCGTIKGPKIDTNHDIVIGMIQSISGKDYPLDTFSDFGLCIFDEVHHTPGRQFSKIFYKIGAKHNLGLSATLTRSDGLTKVIKYFLGDTIINLKLCTIIPNIVIKYTSIEPLPEKTMMSGRINLPRMINDLVDSFARNLEIVNIIKEKYSEERKILVLSDRRRHCMELKRILGPDYSSALYLGQMKNEVLAESNTKRVIFATYQIASEGYDNPKLDTLILSTPKTKIEQAIGRILRQENPNKPEVIDIVDTFSIFNNMYFNRVKFYKKKKYLDCNFKKDNQNEIKLEEYSFIEN